MSSDKKPLYLSSTRNHIAKMYDEISSVVRNAIQQPSLTIEPAKLKTVVVLLDENLISSQNFKELIIYLRDRVKKLVGVYVPREEDIIARLRELGEDKKSILEFLRGHEARRDRKIISELDKLKEECALPIELEIRHRPRMEVIREVCAREKPDLVIMHKKYSAEKDLELNVVINELMNKLSCPILLLE